MELRNIATAALQPNAYNFNEMGEGQLAGLSEQVKRQGFIMHHITARPDPAEADRFIIVDGEHQWRAATAAGLETVPVQVLAFSEAEAVAETYRRNGLRGEANRVKLGRAIRHMQAAAEAEGKRMSNKATAKAMGRTDVWVAAMLDFATLADLAGSRPDFPGTEAEVARLTEKQVRDLLALRDQPPADTAAEGGEAAAGEGEGTGQAPAEQPAEEDKAAKRKARIFKAVAAMTPEEREELRRHIASVEKAEKAKAKAQALKAQGQAPGENGEGA